MEFWLAELPRNVTDDEENVMIESFWEAESALLEMMRDYVEDDVLYITLPVRESLNVVSFMSEMNDALRGAVSRIVSASVMARVERELGEHLSMADVVAETFKITPRHLS